MDAGVGSASTDQRWQLKPEHPLPDEIVTEQIDRESLPKNPVDRPWESQNAYFAAQYSILRCEATEGLRFSVASYRTAVDDPFDDEHTWVYPGVRVKAYLLSRLGPIVRIEFSTKSRINWLQSRRLTPGKLVAVTTNSDGFRNICKIATVAQRPYRDGLDQDPPLVDLMWADPTDAVFDPTTELVMVESKHGYFEATRHALAGLKEVSQGGSPLIKYLTGAHTAETVPAFLLRNPAMDLSSLVQTKAAPVLSEALKSHNIVSNGISNMETATTLDSSQLEGLRRILSQELAIVQGPPGTGKTFTSVEAIKIMVATRRKQGGPPLIIAAQTNHALDHILVQCLNAGIKVVRVGGRAASPLVRDCTIFETQQRCGFAPGDEYRSIEKERQKNMKEIEDLAGTLFGDRCLSPDALRKYGIITESQYKSIEDDSMEVDPSFQKFGQFGLWLGGSLISAESLRNRHTPAPERYDEVLEDFDIDGDLQNIADDEDDQDKIKGKLVSFDYCWSGKEPPRAPKKSWNRIAERELSRASDLFTINREFRGVVYQYLQANLLARIRHRFILLLEENIKFCRQAGLGKTKQDARMIARENTDVVGCTTTGLTKYRQLLSELRPRSLLIEEAAETREANIVSALYSSIQQLILVGDHQQLAPRCDIQWLGSAPFNLEVSLFQRMINLNMPFTMLKQQRRMKPELRLILNPFYSELIDHELVLSPKSRPDVPGMGGRNSWFFDHDWPEETNSDRSKFNDQEAEMITGFFSYLVANGVPADKITILTFYTGQRKVILGKLKRHGSLLGLAFNVFTVDSYQGEENDVVLLSLVRSAPPRRAAAVGFLEDQRRAVVAISRARCGLYIFGNIENALRAGKGSSNPWEKIWGEFVVQGRMQQQTGLPLVCENHKRVTHIREVEDWGDNAGGCDIHCSQIRPCGHRCTLKCHPTPHELLGCNQPCTRQLGCGHGCQGYCSQECFCTCDTFRDIKSGKSVQDARSGSHQTRDEISLEQQLLLSAKTPSAMLQAAADRIGQSKANSGGARFNTYGPGGLRQQAGISSARRAFVQQVNDNEQELEEQRNRDEKKADSMKATPAVIRDVYQPTALVDGCRVDQGERIVEHVGVIKPVKHSIAPEEKQEVRTEVTLEAEPRVKCEVEATPSALEPSFLEHASRILAAGSIFSGNRYSGNKQTSARAARVPTSPSRPVSERRVWVEYQNRPSRASPSSVSSDPLPTVPRKSQDEGLGRDEWLIDL